MIKCKSKKKKLQNTKRPFTLYIYFDMFAYKKLQKMKNSTENLENDHVYILKLTDVMELIAGEAEPDASHIEEVVYLIRNFADGLHHAKEEDILFPFLETRGFPAQSGPVAVMLHEHATGRNFVKRISEGLELYKKGDKAAVEDINRNMKGYSELLKGHISKENNVLFRMADGVMSDEDDRAILSQYDSVVKSRDSGSVGEDFMARIVKLAAIYGI